MDTTKDIHLFYFLELSAAIVVSRSNLLRTITFLAWTVVLLRTHVTEVPRHLNVKGWLTPVLLVTPEGIARREVLPVTTVEDRKSVV